MWAHAQMAAFQALHGWCSGVSAQAGCSGYLVAGCNVLGWMLAVQQVVSDLHHSCNSVVAWQTHGLNEALVGLT
jgi:hypothetical protein